MTRKKEKINKKLFKKIVNDAKKSNIEYVDLFFYNEPLLDKGIFKKIEYVKKQGLKAKFFTNGSLLTKQASEKLLELELDQITFSIDGLNKKEFGKIRIGLDYNNVVSNIKYLVERKKKLNKKKPIIRINYVIDKNKKAYEMKWLKLADEINQGFMDNRKELSLKKKNIKKLYPCHRLWDGLQVMSSGKVALCCVDFDGKYKVGDMNTQTINQVWNSKKFKKIRKLHLKGKGNQIEICKNCVHLYRSAVSEWWFKQP